MKKLFYFLIIGSLIYGVRSSIEQDHPQSVQSLVGVDLTKTYYLGETIDFSQVKLEHGGQEYEPTIFTFTYPSGIRTTKRIIDLNESGRCHIFLATEVNGTKITCQEHLDVLKNLCESKTGKSTAILQYNDLFEETGIDIRLAPKDEVKINKVVDLRHSKFDGESSFIDFYFNPIQVGKPDAYTFYMTLTDIHDDANWIIVRLKSWSDMGPWADGNTYIDCKAPNQEFTTASNDLEDFYYAKRDQNNKHGWYISLVSMCGRNANGVTQNDQLSFYFDVDEKQIVTNHAYYNPSVPYEKACITDFDDPKFYNLNKEKLWDGFTTGEVYVSFSAFDFNGASANLFVTSMLGVDFNEDFVDVTAPKITVNYQGYAEDSLPFAVINRPYRVFGAYAYDTSDAFLPVETNVYFDYEGKKIITSLTDGCFTPTKTGIYTIEYRARDHYGNEAIKTVEIAVYTDSEYATFSFVMNQVALVGQKRKLIDQVELVNFNGVPSLTVSVFDGHQTIYLDDDYYFTSEYSGAYRVKVEARDYIKTYVKEFDFYVLANNKPVFDEDYKLRKYFAKDVEYVLENIKAKAYTPKGFQLLDAEVYYSYDGATFTKVSQNRVTFTTAGMITLKYVASAHGESSEILYTAEVVDVDHLNGLKMEKYFKVLNGEATYHPTDNDLEMVVSNGTTLEFINPIQVHNLILNFNVMADFNKLEQINFYLTDLHDDNVALKLSYEKNFTGSLFRINDGEETIFVKSDFSGAEASLFRLEYDESDYTVTPTANVAIVPTKTLNGKSFNGFPSRFAHLKIEFVTASPKVGIHNLKINGQSFFNLDEDIFKPQILVKRNSGNKRLNEVVLLEHATFADVFSDNLEATMSVKTPSGGYAVATDGTVLNASCDPGRDYEIRCDEIGTYTVSYTCFDGAGMVARYNYVFNAIDNVPPTISVSNMVTRAKVGEMVPIAKAEVSDNYSEATYFTIVEYPDGSMQHVSDRFEATLPGTYRVFYYVSDRDGNLTIAYYLVEVHL